MYIESMLLIKGTSKFIVINLVNFWNIWWNMLKCSSFCYNYFIWHYIDCCTILYFNSSPKNSHFNYYEKFLIKFISRYSGNDRWILSCIFTSYLEVEEATILEMSNRNGGWHNHKMAHCLVLTFDRRSK